MHVMVLLPTAHTGTNHKTNYNQLRVVVVCVILLHSGLVVSHR